MSTGLHGTAIHMEIWRRPDYHAAQYGDDENELGYYSKYRPD